MSDGKTIERLQRICWHPWRVAGFPVCPGMKEVPLGVQILSLQKVEWATVRATDDQLDSSASN